jgi:hypothetical protein
MGITADDVKDIADLNGFWDRDKRPWDFLSWSIRDHLLHILAELDEYEESDSVEEAADAAIVILDLLGHLGADLDIEDVWPGVVSVGYWRYIAEAYNQYRKTGEFEFNLLTGIIQDLMEAWGKTPLVEAIEAKCAKNKTRGELYGVAK